MSEMPVIAAIYVNPKLKLKNSTMYPKITLEKDAIVKPIVKYNPNIWSNYVLSTLSDRTL